MINAACLYAPIWDFKNGDEFFYNSYGGWPDYAIATNSVRIIRQTQLEDLKKYWTEEECDVYEKGFDQCKGFKTLI